jgi:hypothetical protein
VTLLACPVCFGDPAAPQSHGLRLAIAALLLVLFALLAAFAVVARRWLQREALLEGSGGDALSGQSPQAQAQS